jgi:putative PIG3 family NAD(P)H quinone oxidoreductase
MSAFDQVPDTMVAVEIREPGGADVLQAAQIPVPRIGAEEVLIRVAAAGVNRPDVLQRKGQYAPPPGTTTIPGLELAGEVVRVGANVVDWRVGDSLCALVAGGGYAQYAAAPAVQCLPVPNGMSLEEAAALPETVLTVYFNVFERAGLRKGETLLVHGGTSGIGTTAIMLAKAFGARVIVTAGSADKCAACLKLGAAAAINYKEKDFVAATLAATGGQGADVILDMVGGSYVARNVDAAAVDGRIAVIATQGGSRGELELHKFMAKRLAITGSTLRAQSVASKGRLVAAVRTNVWPMFEQRGLRPIIHARFPLTEASKAHALMESGAHVGKIVLVA